MPDSERDREWWPQWDIISGTNGQFDDTDSINAYSVIDLSCNPPSFRKRSGTLTHIQRISPGGFRVFP